MKLVAFQHQSSAIQCQEHQRTTPAWGQVGAEDAAMQADWQVLQTAVELASQLVEAKEHRLIILDRDRGFRLLQHPHPEDGARRPVDFLDHQNPLRPAT